MRALALGGESPLLRSALRHLLRVELRPALPGRDREPAPPTAWLAEDENWSDQPGLSDYELVDQDMSNMLGCQIGLRNLPDRPLQLSGYQEAAISHFHHLLYDKWLKEPE